MYFVLWVFDEYNIQINPDFLKPTVSSKHSYTDHDLTKEATNFFCLAVYLQELKVII